MREKPVTVREFEERLAALCGGTGRSMPRKQRDRHIIFRSIVQALAETGIYSEQSLNAALKQWILTVGSGIAIDHVTLRRYLVESYNRIWCLRD